MGNMENLKKNFRNKREEKKKDKQTFAWPREFCRVSKDEDLFMHDFAQTDGYEHRHLRIEWMTGNSNMASACAKDQQERPDGGCRLNDSFLSSRPLVKS